MKILAVNPGHNGSAAYLVDGKTVFYIEEERLTRAKYDANPFRGILTALEGGIDVLVIGGTHKQPSLTWTGEDPFTGLVRKFNPQVQIVDVTQNHHLGHAAGAFFNSGFEEAAAVIVDGSGSRHQYDTEDGFGTYGFECESIFDCTQTPEEEEEPIKDVFRSYGGNWDVNPVRTEKITIDNSMTLVKMYEGVSDYLGFGYIEAGKTMGLAPYGKDDPNIPDLVINGRGNKNVFIPNYPAGSQIDEAAVPYLARSSDPKEWHKDPDKVTEQAKNLAWKIQKQTQEAVGDLIEKAVKITDKKNIVIAGGYGLNCVANYYYKERFPDLNIFVDPISHDGGTSLGLAKLIYHKFTKQVPDKLDTLYLGTNGIGNTPEESLIESLKNGGFEVESDVTNEKIAEMISEQNIIAIYQGRSEAGPRALGNRSILYDPRDPNGKDRVNIVKGREWFRPFAGSMLKENFEEWFETRGLEETPHMMYAMDFKLEKHGEVPAITHVDGTCRIQTVTEEQNKNYYDLIKAFNDITGVPILFNTSFNLAGEPLVETLDDALKTIANSDLDYLYLPEWSMLIKAPFNYSDQEDPSDENESEEEFFDADEE